MGIFSINPYVKLSNLQFGNFELRMPWLSSETLKAYDMGMCIP